MVSTFAAFKRRHMRRGQLSPSQLLQKPLFQPSNGREKPPPPPPNLAKRPRRYLTKEDRMRIIYTRYGSLTRLDNVLMTCEEVSRKLMIPNSTVGFVVSQYERRGCDFDRLARPKGQFSRISGQLKQRLLAPALLNAWVAFSLTERSEIVHRHWGVKISRSSLRNLYRANGVYYS